jgi:VWFA-related protein
MRRYLLCLILLCASVPVFAARSIPVGELEQQLAALRGKADVDAAFQIGAIVLTERLSWTRESELEKTLPGEMSRQALRAIADESQFRDPPLNEIPSQPAPDTATQRGIMGRVVAYVSKTIPQLPNFLASRATDQYEDTPQLVASQTAVMVPYQPMHFLATQTSDVAYQDGKEMRGGTAKVSAQLPTASGLNTWGVFGPILSTVLLDAAQSQVAWSHWEQGPDGVRAVFSYAVPKAKSHYEVVYCCVAEQAGVRAANLFPFRKLEGYHGEIAIDPATGIIRRLTLKAELKADDPVVKADIMVEYGPVEIGGQAYTCPLRSVSSSRAESVQVDPNFHFSLANQLQPLKNQIADTTFENYHVFRSETRVLTAEEANEVEKTAPVQQAAVQTPGAAPASTAAASTAPSAPPSINAPAASATPASAVDAATDMPALQQRPAPPPDDAGEPEISATDASSLPEQAAGAQAPLPNTGFTLRTTTRLVEVALVATDKKGRPITDLKPEDLEIFDNGREQKVKDFTQAGADVLMAAASAPSPQASADEPVSTNRPGVGTAAAIAQDSGNTTVLMIDAAHVAFSDLNYARGEMQRFLKTVPADESVGLYILRSYGFQVLREPTADHAGVAEALAKWMPSAQDLMHAQDEEQRNRQQIDWVHSVYDMAYVNGNGEGGSDASMYATNGVAAAAMHPPDAELRPMGDRPEEFALHLLVGVGRHLAAIPGHKTLVWIASDNVLADWNSSMVGQEDNGNRFLGQSSLRARETLNEAHVSIYPLDVSQLEGGGISASLANRNVTPMGKTDRDISVAQAMGDASPANKNGRDTARLNADTHPIQPAFRELAEATGGRALRRAGDIAAELSSIVADGRAAYLLSFSPDTQADGKYHTLTVKCLRKGVTLRYRNGYLYSAEPATIKDRFREAVWEPRDESEIGLMATVVREPIGQGLRLNIAAADLQMAQQGGRWTDKVDVFLVLRDDSALHAVIGGKRLGLSLRPATYQRDMKEGLTVEEKLPKLLPGTLLRLIVIDENSRRIGSVTVDAGQWSVNGETAQK